MQIVRGTRGNARHCDLSMTSAQTMRFSQEDSQLGFVETIFSSSPREFLELAVAIINKQPVLALADNEEMKAMARMILALEDNVDG